MESKIPLSVLCPICGHKANKVARMGKEYFCIDCMLEINLRDKDKVRLYRYDTHGNRKPYFQG